MAEAVTRTGDAYDVVNGVRGNVMTQKAELLAGWSSTASMSFDRVVNTWNDKCINILDALNELRENLGAARLTYEVTEEQQTDSVNKVDELLNGLT